MKYDICTYEFCYKLLCTLLKNKLRKLTHVSIRERLYYRYREIIKKKKLAQAVYSCLICGILNKIVFNEKEYVATI